MSSYLDQCSAVQCSAVQVAGEVVLTWTGDVVLTEKVSYLRQLTAEVVLTWPMQRKNRCPTLARGRLNLASDRERFPTFASEEEMSS